MDQDQHEVYGGPEMRRIVAAIVLALLAAACGESPLSDVGGRIPAMGVSQSGRGRHRVGACLEADPDLVGASELRWWNDGLGEKNAAPAPLLLQQISSRRTVGNRFADASRFEIAALYPEMGFPDRVPSRVESVTSQLILDPSVAALDPRYVASFGLWARIHIRAAGSGGQVAGITVFNGAETDPCDVIGPGCLQEEHAGMVIGRLPGASGETLVWSDGGLTYEMFVDGGAGGAAVTMATSFSPLEQMVSDPAPADPITTVPRG